MPPQVGLIGLGLLGSALSSRWLESGYRVVGYDRNPQARDHLAMLGGYPVDSAEHVCRGLKHIVLCLPDHQVVRAVLLEIMADLKPGQVVIDMSTGESAAAEAAHQLLRQRQVDYLEATISGSGDHVRRGEALVMTGGDLARSEDCRDLFSAIAATVIHAGPVGTASKLKLVTNLVLGLNRAALAEGWALAQALGLQPATTLEALCRGPAYSRIMDTKVPKLLHGDFSPQARLAQHHKDVQLMLRAGQQVGMELPLTECHERLLKSAVEKGWGELDNCALYKLYEKQVE